VDHTGLMDIDDLFKAVADYERKAIENPSCQVQTKDSTSGASSTEAYRAGLRLGERSTLEASVEEGLLATVKRLIEGLRVIE